MNDIRARLEVSGPQYDTERMRIDRLSRFLVLATEQPESGFRHFGLTGRMTRVGLQLGWTEDQAQAEIWHRYTSHLEVFRRHPEMFIETTNRLRLEYGDELLQRWGVLGPTD